MLKRGYCLHVVPACYLKLSTTNALTAHNEATVALNAFRDGRASLIKTLLRALLGLHRGDSH